MTRTKLHLKLLIFLLISKSHADSSVIYSAYLRNEIRGTLSHISEKGLYSTLGKHYFLIVFLSI